MPLPQPAAQDDTLSELPEPINCRLTEKGLKIEKASAVVIDATIIQTAGSKQRQAIEVDEEGQVSGQTPPSKDSDARWTKKNGLYRLGYKQHTRTDEEGYIENLHITPANIHECNYLSPLLEGIALAAAAALFALLFDSVLRAFDVQCAADIGVDAFGMGLGTVQHGIALAAELQFVGLQ